MWAVSGFPFARPTRPFASRTSADMLPPEPPSKRARVEGTAGDGEPAKAPADTVDGVDVKTGVSEPMVSVDTTNAPDAPKTEPDATDPEPGSSSRIKKRKVSIFLAYVGKGYQGFQRNPGAVTIEDELERAIVAAGGISPDNAGDFSKVGWTRAARTDKGVSAVGQSISLRMMLEHPDDKRDVIERINEKLPSGFEMFGFTRVTGGFNAKTMCDRRRYEYVIPTKAFDTTQCRPRADIEGERELLDGSEGNNQSSNSVPLTFDEAMRQKVEKILNNYVGTHNFHNYTVRVSPDDPAAMRYILSFDCSMPFTVNGVEFVKTTVVGQSFMLHQIRKLIGMMLGVVRGSWSERDQIFALNTKETCGTPMAPELGLFLCECIYHAYNTRFGDTHTPLTLDKYSDKVDAFKTKFIYPHMADTEKSENTMENWIRMLPVKQVVSSIEHARRKDAGKWEAVFQAKQKTNKKKSNQSGKRKAGAMEGGGDEKKEKDGEKSDDVNTEETPKQSVAAAEPVAGTEVEPVVAIIAEPLAAAPVAVEPVATEAVAEPEPAPTPQVEVPPPPPAKLDANTKGPAGEYAPAPNAPAAGRGGRCGRGPKYELGKSRGRGGGRGRGRGAAKNQVKNAKSNQDFDPAELSD